MQRPLWRPPLDPVPANPNRYLAGVCVSLPIWLLSAFILVFLVPGTIAEYRLAHDQGGLRGTVTLTEYVPPHAGPRGRPGECVGSFLPADGDPGRSRQDVEVFLEGECRVGAELPARVCPAPAFQYRDDCVGYAWTEGAGTWRSMLIPLGVAGPAWLVCNVVMLVFFVKWRRAVRRAAQGPFGGT